MVPVNAGSPGAMGVTVTELAVIGTVVSLS